MKSIILRLVFISIFSLICATANAVTFDSWHRVWRNNTAGITTKILPPVVGHFCYLGRVIVQETDTSGEAAGCNVGGNGTVWVLQAFLGKSSDADVECVAFCYNSN